MICIISNNFNKNFKIISISRNYMLKNKIMSLLSDNLISGDHGKIFSSKAT